MALLSEHIAHIKSVLSRGAESDDSRYSDRQIYFLLRYLRAELFKQKLDKYNYVSPFNYQTIPCIPLELVTEDEGCECSSHRHYGNHDGLFKETWNSTDCVILRTVSEIPRPIVNRKQMFLKVWTQGGVSIDPASSDDVKYAKYSKIKKNLLSYEVINNRIYVKGTTTLKALKIRALFADPLAVNIPGACGDGEVVCFDPYTDEFPLDLEMTRAMNKLTYEELVDIMAKMPEDVDNDSLDTTIQPVRQ